MNRPELHVCHICGEAPPAIVMRAISRLCTRVAGGRVVAGGPSHTWWVCSVECAFALGERAGLGSLEFEAGVHPVEAGGAT
jgi:hypothetical protein